MAGLSRRIFNSKVYLLGLSLLLILTLTSIDVQDVEAADIVIFEEDFEDGFPRGANDWSVGDDNSSGTRAYWGDVNSSFGGEATAHGSYKAYAAADPSSSSYCGSTTNPSYRQYMSSYMNHDVDLTKMNTARVSFYYKIPAYANGGTEARFSISNSTRSRVISYRNDPVTTWTKEEVDHTWSHEC